MRRKAHGGRRPGAGRPRSKEPRKLTRSVCLSPLVVAYMKDRGSGMVETLIRESEDFKKWLGEP